jgi:HD-GYP domain-containing protein (c-di-GMP phosphodiesterase class II)
VGDSTLEQVQLIFAYLNGFIRTAGLYLPAHPQTRKAKQTLYHALTGFLTSHGRLDYRFMGDLLVANERILPRESLVYRRFIDVCQTEKGIGSLCFTPGVEEREIDAVLEALTEGTGPSLAGWAARRRLSHVFLAPPTQPDKQSGEAVARRAYYGSVETLREVEATIRARAPLSVEQIGTLRVFTSAMLEQILATPGLVLRLASIKSYDEYTLYHSVNVAVIAIGLGVAIGLKEPILRELAMAGMLHDLGKIAVPLEILRKPGLLEEDEWRVMRRHPVLGADLLSRLPGSNRLPMIVAFEHHMRFDTRGYPFIREGWVQHPVSRLACMADVFDAMTSRRAYKKAIPIENVRAYVREEASRTFDPRLVTVLDQLLQSIREIREDAPLETPA